MPWLVARSGTGEVVAEDTVDVERVVEVLCRWLKVLSRDAVLSIDEVPLTEADKERLRRSGAAPAPAPAPAELQHIRSYFDTMHVVFENVRQAEWESLRRVQSFSREMADEMVRQRDLMHRCLKDVDAVDRSVTATGATNQIQGGMRAIAEQERGGMTVEDLLHGFSKFLRGLKG
jgi:hypothetical protein